MKTMVAISMLIAFTIGACSTPDKKVENAKEEVVDSEKELAKAKADLEIDVADYRKEMYMKIAANNAKIDEINLEINQNKGDKNKDKKVRIDELKKRNSDLEMKIKNYNQSDKDNWESFKREFNSDMESLGSAFGDLTRDNKK